MIATGYRNDFDVVEGLDRGPGMSTPCLRGGSILSARIMKLAFEKYFLWQARHGYVKLP